MDYPTARAILAGRRLPAVIVDLDAFDLNLSLAAGIARNAGPSPTLRLATKSLRVPELIRRVLSFGPPFAGLMCYSAEEAAFLGELGFDDLLVAYPTIQSTDLAALRPLVRAGRGVTLMVDGPAGLTAVARAWGEADPPLDLLLDVDMSLRLWGGRAHIGVRRSPTRNLEDVLASYQAAEDFPNVRLVGLMGYEAQVAGLGDRNPFQRWQRPLLSWIRKQSMTRIVARRRELAQALASRGYRLDIFNGGGSGSLNWTVREPWLTEATIGSGLLCPHLFDYFSNIEFQPACFFAVQTVRFSDPGLATCQGGGYVASGSPGWDKVPRPWLPAGMQLLSTEGCGEVQTPLRLPRGTNLELGDPVLFRHAKAGELAERFNEYLLVSGGRIVDKVQTYRGLGRCFF